MTGLYLFASSDNVSLFIDSSLGYLLPSRHATRYALKSKGLAPVRWDMVNRDAMVVLASHQSYDPHTVSTTKQTR